MLDTKSAQITKVRWVWYITIANLPLSLKHQKLFTSLILNKNKLTIYLNHYLHRVAYERQEIEIKRQEIKTRHLISASNKVVLY